ncbi:MAG: hypothetical protein ACI9Y7_002401 [Dokdonia sp.]|jgi:hypothetical protein
MKYNRTLVFLIISLIFMISSCQNSTDEKIEFIYENGNRKVEIQILNGNDYLEYDEPINTNFVFTNIEPQNYHIYGAGIRILGINDGIVKTEIRVPKDYLENDTLPVMVRYGSGSNEVREFKIPIKIVE